jgi:hypothetical protein
VAWVSWSAVVLGVALVVVAVTSLTGRQRPLRRALRRLSWRAEAVRRLQARATATQDRLAALQADAERIREHARRRVGPDGP